MPLQHSAACERNREPILAVLREVFAQSTRVLEIGSGTGQHAVYFGPQLPHLLWQTSDLPQHHASIIAWQQAQSCPNVLPPLALDMSDQLWNEQAQPPGPFDAVFSANTCHIMAWPEVQNMFAGIGKLLPPNGVAAIYGPFNYGGRYTSEGNARFDSALRARAAHMGLRDFEAIDALAAAAGLVLEKDVAMPANNRLLVWRRA